MSGLSTSTLMIAIQAVARETARLRDEIASRAPDEAIGIEEVLQDMLLAEDELRDLYDPIQSRSDNLPTWESLTDVPNRTS